MTELKFGKDFRKEFPLEEGYVPMNHGSFGTYPKSLIPIVRRYQDRAEANPDRFNRLELEPIITENLKAIAELINCDPVDIGFVPNATSGGNTVLRSFPFKEGDKIIYFETTYATINNALQFLSQQYKVEIVKIELRFPLENEEILQLTKEIIKRENAKGGKKIVMAVMDAIISLPGVRFPFEAVSKLVQEHGILSCIDGAHVIGQIPIDIKAVDPDFFFSNCHKWLYTPRGCAVLYVAKRNQGFVHPVSIGYGYAYHTESDDTSTFYTELLPGTIDTTSYLVVKDALAYRKSIGGEEAICKYTHEIAVQGGDLVAKLFGTTILENSTNSYTASMVNIELPPFKTTKSDAEIPSYFIHQLIYKYRTMAAIYKHNNKWWVRLSGQIYVDLDDFKIVAESILAIIEELNSE